MFHNAKNRNYSDDKLNVDYLTFGKGTKTLIMIPGLGDAIKTAKGMAIPLSFMYKEYAKDYTVYLISRRNNIPKGFTIKDMANDLDYLMDKLNIDKADIMGVSQGGMIAQELAINHPNRVNKLVLAVTAPRKNTMIETVVNNWIKAAKKKDFKTIVIDTAEKSYTEDKLKRYRRIYGLLYRVNKPKDYKRFIIQAESCLNHDAYNDLDKIKCKTFIIGGKLDKIVGVDASYELHEHIKDSEIYIYEKYGHGVYEHAKDFNTKILEFLNKEG